jgi:hypothetical protein
MIKRASINRAEQSRPDAVKKIIHWVVDSIGSWKAALAREGEKERESATRMET